MMEVPFHQGPKKFRASGPILLPHQGCPHCKRDYVCAEHLRYAAAVKLNESVRTKFMQLAAQYSTPPYYSLYIEDMQNLKFSIFICKEKCNP